MSKKRGLGRGLDALLGSTGINPASLSQDMPEQPVATERLQDIPIDLIQRGRFQPRHDFEPVALQELADSIRAQGVVQPVVVRPLKEKPGHFELIAGERRWRASQLAEMHTIPAVVRDVPDKAAMAIGLIENIQRQELNPMEEAGALQRLVDEFSLTHQETAEAVGRSRVAVTNLLRLLSLEPEVKAMLEKGQLEMGHARALLALNGNEQVQAARQVAEKGMSVRECEDLVRRLQNPTHISMPRQDDPDVKHLQNDLSEKLGARVQITHSNKGKGKLVIQYNSLDELDGILAHIN